MIIDITPRLADRASPELVQLDRAHLLEFLKPQAQYPKGPVRLCSPLPSAPRRET